ncbi:MAG: hypothetical protein IJK02_10740 [Clostridia bacterium]|nr:hypothetical protein [Clostridia bacterium]MBR0509958.1 hypothetical protein [Clostridia bacterium]
MEKEKKCTVAKVLKVISIILAVAAAIAGVCVIVKKIAEKKQLETSDEENYVSCSCEEEFSSETIA